MRIRLAGDYGGVQKSSLANLTKLYCSICDVELNNKNLKVTLTEVRP